MMSTHVLPEPDLAECLPLPEKELKAIPADCLLAYARAFADSTHSLHDFGRACAVELVCRDQFEYRTNPARSIEAELALLELTSTERRIYGVNR